MTRAYRDEYEPPPESVESLPLFAEPQVRKMARRSDPDTSKAAAVNVSGIITSLQRRIYQVFVARGRMSPKQAEALPEFADLGFSTVRKRCSELVAISKLRPTGRVIDGSQELEVIPTEKP